MSRAKHQLQRRRRAIERIDRLLQQPDLVLIVHYSSETLRRADGTSPRITSIAVRRYGSGQTNSFSIHQQAERQRIPFADIASRYDDLEQAMLRDFFDFVQRHSAHEWVHWNMRDSTFGFAALEHRFAVLKGIPVEVPEPRRLDLAAAMHEIYGPSYAPHGDHGRLESLLALNEITRRDFLPGPAEAEAFAGGEYVNMHRSTLRKVDGIATVLAKTWDDTLKTNASWKDKYGTTIGGVIEAVTETWWYKLLGIIAIIASFVGLVALVQ
jgi:hypothetical protein